MVKLICVYFEYIKNLYKILTKYIAVLQVYTNHFIILIKFIKMTFIIIIIIYLY